MRDILISKEAGKETTLHFDDVDGTFTVASKEDVSPLIEQNKIHRNHANHGGNMRKAAEIPMSVYLDLEKRGITKDQKAFRRWLNDPDNRFFRTNESYI
ncbi:MAG: hypothetical protein ACPH3M_08285 [Candidatus Puniceispirillales bacterium]